MASDSEQTVARPARDPYPPSPEVAEARDAAIERASGDVAKAKFAATGKEKPCAAVTESAASVGGSNASASSAAYWHDLHDLIAACERMFTDAVTANEPDDEFVMLPGAEGDLTFGMIRKARAAHDALTAVQS